MYARRAAPVCAAIVVFLGARPASALPWPTVSRGAPYQTDQVVATHVAPRDRRPDEARRAYLEAAERVPHVRDWLLLRAARLTSDSAARSALYDRLKTSVARAHILPTEAAALEQAGDLQGAAARYDSLGQPTDALRLRLRLATSAAERTAIRRALRQLLNQRAISPETARAGDLIISAFAPITADEALRIARVAVEMRQFARAATYFPRGLTSPHATGNDRLAYGRSLLRLGRARDAIRTLGQVRGTSALRAAAAFERARAQLKLGDPVGARGTLSQLTERFPAANATVPQALLLLGDLAWDNDRPAEARTAFLEAARRAPASNLAPRARFLAALAAWHLGNVSQAAREWEQLHRAGPSSERAAAGYWAGRAQHRLGNKDRARATWALVRARDTLSYYAVVSAERLGVAPWGPVGAMDRFKPLPDVDSALTRIALLREMAFSAEVGWERDWLVGRATESPERGLATSHALHRAGEFALGARIARQALAAGAPADARTYRLLYPLPYRNHVKALGAEFAVDPLLVAALIRRESAWDSRATSAAGARGLMEVMPRTGERMARRLRMPTWRADHLYDPLLNLRIGTGYLRERLERCQRDLVCTLAGYNAGPSPVARWMAQAGADDRDFLIERIGYSETRNYVRIIHRNAALYRSLYR